MVRWCARHGARVRVADTREAPANLPALRAHVPDAEFIGGPFAPSLLEGVALVAISPGLSPLDAAVAALLDGARERAVPVWGEIELFARALAGLKLAQGYAPRVLPSPAPTARPPPRRWRVPWSSAPARPSAWRATSAPRRWTS